MSGADDLLRGKHSIRRSDLARLSPSDVQELRRVATDPSSTRNRARAIAALGRLDPAVGHQALESIAANPDEAESLRAVAITTLGRARMREAAPTLVELAASDSPLLSAKALLALARTGGDAAARVATERMDEPVARFARLAIAARVGIPDVALPTPPRERSEPGALTALRLTDADAEARADVAFWIAGDTFGLDLERCACSWVRCDPLRLFLVVDVEVALRATDLDHVRVAGLLAFPNEVDGSYATDYVGLAGKAEGGEPSLAVFRTDGSLRFAGYIREPKAGYEVWAEHVAPAALEPAAFTAIARAGRIERLSVAAPARPAERSQPAPLEGF